MKLTRKARIVVAIVLVGLLVISGGIILTSSQSTKQSGKLLVTASFYPLYYFCNEIGKDRVEVNMLIPDNVEPHTWEPAPSDLIKVSNSKVLVYNGVNFEPWMSSFLGQVDQSKVSVVDTSAGVDLLLSDTVIWPYDQAVALLADGPNLSAATSLDRLNAQVVEAAPSVVTVEISSDGSGFSGYLRLNLTTPDDFRIFMTNDTQFEVQYDDGTTITPELTLGYEDRYPFFNNSKFMGMESETTGMYYMHFTSASNQTKMVIVQGSGEEEVEGVVHEHGVNDPHFWIDPISAKVQVNNIAHALETADPANATFYQANADNLNDRLDSLNQEYVVGLQNRTKNAIITTHEGFNYLAQRYHFDAYGAVGISGDNQPSAQDIAALADQVRALDLHYVFSEPVFSDAVIDTVASETGAQVLVLDGVHGRSGVHVDMDYFQIMRANLEALEKGLEVTS